MMFEKKVMKNVMDLAPKEFEQNSEDQKYIAEPNNLKFIINQKSLELIAKEIGKLDSSSNLIGFLINCGVKKEFIKYSDTKWRMILSVFLKLVSSDKGNRKILFKIIEGACHPLMYGGNKDIAKKAVDKFNSFLEYDNCFIREGILWQGWDDGSGYWTWDDKDGNSIESSDYMVLPEKMDRLYVYWNELIKLTKFYFDNKDSQDDEINSIYFEIIANIERLLNGNGCGDLKEIYKKPFGNIVGCEFEIQKQNLTSNDLLVNLYGFLGKITEFLLPDKDNVEKIKQDNSAFFSHIKQYCEQHIIKPEAVKEPTTKIEITKIPELQIKGFEEKSALQKIKNKNPTPFDLPPNTIWGDIEIDFNNEYDVDIYIKEKFFKKSNNEEMGFSKSGTKEKKPDVQWDFLLLLSVIHAKNEKEATKNKISLSLGRKLNKKISENNCEQIKSKLSKQLQEKFGIEDKPFYLYKDYAYYKPKFELKPIPLLRGDGEVFISPRDEFNDNIKYNNPEG